MRTLEGFAAPFGPPPATSSPLASPFGDFGTCTFPTTPARYDSRPRARPRLPRRAREARVGQGQGV
jgi:hypothetical protein